MSDTEERAATKELSERLGFRVIDDSDWTFDNNGSRVSAQNTYWFVVSGHDDERLDQPIRHGQWPQTAEIVIRQLWHRCVALSTEKRNEAMRSASKRLKLFVFASVLLVASLAIPVLFGALHLMSLYQLSIVWHYCGYLAVAAVGALIAGSWTHSGNERVYELHIKKILGFRHWDKRRSRPKR